MKKRKKINVLFLIVISILALVFLLISFDFFYKWLIQKPVPFLGPYGTCDVNSDCGINGFTGTGFCQSADVWRNYITYTCNIGYSNYCSDVTTSVLIQDCPVSCFNGACCAPKTCSELGKQCNNWNDECGGSASCGTCPTGQNCNLTGQCVNTDICSSNSDCGLDGYTGTNLCSNGDVKKNFKTFTCNNPGTTNSYCSNVTELLLIQDCPVNCFNAVCCAPKTCSELGKSCGSWDDECGGTVSCGGSCVTDTGNGGSDGGGGGAMVPVNRFRTVQNQSIDEANEYAEPEIQEPTWNQTNSTTEIPGESKSFFMELINKYKNYLILALGLFLFSIVLVFIILKKLKKKILSFGKKK